MARCLASWPFEQPTKFAKTAKALGLGVKAASWEESARQRLLDEDPVRAARDLGPDVELDRLRQQGGGESRQRGSVQGHRKGGLSDIKRALCAVAASRLRCTAQLGTASARLAN